jgi:DNA processing protein
MDTYSKGCNDYIRENKAGLITSANDLVWMMGWTDDKNAPLPAVQTQLFVDLTQDEEQLVQFLRENGECGIDAISTATALSFSKLAATLLQLELKGVIRLRPGKRYSL